MALDDWNCGYRTMRRAVAAALAFNVYAVIVFQAFWAAMPALFYSGEIEHLANQGTPFRFEDWGFGAHYLARLFTAIVATAVPGFICGAIARSRGGRVALIANIPSALGWIAYAWMCFFVFDNVEMQLPVPQQQLLVAYGLISLVAAPLTCWIASKSGDLGEEVQKAHASHPNNTLGVHDWHWAWMWIPLSPYGYRIVTDIGSLIQLNLVLWSDRTFLGGALLVLGMGTAIAWIAPLVVSYQILAGNRFEDKTPRLKGTIICVLLVGGYLVAHLITYAFGLILTFFKI